MGGGKGQGGTRMENGEGRTERRAWGVGGCQWIGERIERKRGASLWGESARGMALLGISQNRR